mmetsp:Transcript_108813/g.162767  ORF Transcript_108813/g.162767 Transcript_108813/m.162767 type:complete len:163 (+) Transcript_108813:61-549(+)
MPLTFRYRSNTRFRFRRTIRQLPRRMFVHRSGWCLVALGYLERRGQGRELERAWQGVCRLFAGAAGSAVVTRLCIEFTCGISTRTPGFHTSLLFQFGNDSNQQEPNAMKGRSIARSHVPTHIDQPSQRSAFNPLQGRSPSSDDYLFLELGLVDSHRLGEWLF